MFAMSISTKPVNGSIPIGTKVCHTFCKSIHFVIFIGEGRC